MTGRTWSAAAVLALAVAVPALPVLTASTASAGGGSTAQLAKPGDGDRAGKSGKDKKAKKAKKRDFNLGGRLTTVDGTANSVTFRVHGGRDKALRGTELTVVVAEDARVRRNDAPATPAEFLEGDKVRAKGVKTDGVYTATRIHAEAPDLDED